MSVFDNDPLKRAELWDRCYPGNLNIEMLVDDLKDGLNRFLTPRHISEYHEDMGDVLWWKFPIDEPPYVGHPNVCGYRVEARLLSSDGEEREVSMYVGGWPGYHEWFTNLPSNEQVGLIQSRIEARIKEMEKSA